MIQAMNYQPVVNHTTYERAVLNGCVDTIHVSFIMDDSANLMRYDDVNWVPIPVDISGPVDSSTLATDGDTIAGLYSGLFGSHVCKVVSDTTNCINSGLANSIAVIDGHVFVYGPNRVEVWDVEQKLIQLPLGNASPWPE